LDPIESAPAIVAGAFFIGFVIQVGFVQAPRPRRRNCIRSGWQYTYDSSGRAGEPLRFERVIA
jgi:hypothetical protein